MQNGREHGPDDVKIEGEETRESIERPVDPETQLDEVARSAGDKVGGDEEGVPEAETESDPDAVRIDTNDEAAPEDPDEAQSPT